MNNLKLVNTAFDLLKEEEAKINYYYEPIFLKNNKNWKRHLNFSELRKDYIKDIIDYGFSPYSEHTCEEQMKNKDIMKFYKERNHDYTIHIKKLNFFLKNKKNSDKLLNNKMLSCGNYKRDTIKIKKIPKLKEYKSSSFLADLYKSINETNINNKNKRYTSANNSINKKKAKIVKFSRDDIIDYKKLKKEKLLENELNKSFSYESNEYNKNDNEDYHSKYNKDSIIKIEKYNYKNYNQNYANNNINNKSRTSNLKINSFYNLDIIRNSINENLKEIKPLRKILKMKSYNNNSLNKNNSNSTKFSKDKSITNLLKINNHYSQKKQYKRYKYKRNTSIEKLENISGGIFKIAVKYDYLAKKYKNIK